MELTNYLKFLAYFQSILDKDFEAQAPFIKCKMGCAQCCQSGDYPFSQIELEFLKKGFRNLKPEVKQEIINKIKNLLNKKLEFQEETFMHECPFLIDNVCSVYLCRGLICRTFGLIHFTSEGRTKMPFCVHKGLNYADIYDSEKNMFTQEKIEELGYTIEPKSYNLDYNFITDKKFSDVYKFDYGKKGPLLEIIKEDEYFKSLL